MANKTFLTKSAKEFAEVLSDAIDSYDSDNGFKVSGTQIVERKKMAILVVRLVDGTEYHVMIEQK